MSYCQRNSTTDAEIQTNIIAEFGLQSDAFATPAIVAMWWNFFSDKDSQYLQYLYTRKRVIAYLLSTVRAKINLTLGTDKFSNQQRFQNVLDMMKAAADEIKLEDPYGATPYLQSTRAMTDPTPSEIERRLLFWENCWMQYYGVAFEFWPEFYAGPDGDKSYW